jgi:hypothetical protein
MRLFFITILLSLELGASAQFWPKEFTSTQGKIVLYQPQPQKFDGNKVSGVMAFSLLTTAKKEPYFGALFFDARLLVDRDTRKYALDKLDIPNLKFSGKPEGLNEEKVKASIIDEVESWDMKGSLDELIATVEEFNMANTKNENFRNDPPVFIYTNTPSVLIMIDGEPKMQDIQNTDLRHVANTGYVIFENKSDRKFYLFGGEIWYAAQAIKGPWQVTKNVPSDIKKLLDQNKEAAKSAGKVEQTGKETPPAIVVATVPTELIQTKGEAEWKKYDSAAIEYADNTEDNLFRIGSTFYILKSGRWFSSALLANGWKYLPADQLPKEFAKIPSGSPKDIILSSVPGTVEARDALLDAQVPQTATVDRKTAGKDIKVQYDGKPQFEKIEGTSLELVKNSDKTVFRATAIPSGSQAGNAVHDERKYYMVDNGIWYVSSSTDGPWYVSDSRPADIDNIPPSSSAYNTKYVQIYDATPSVVYVGYTPGYMGSYVYGPTVVYGTGYPYMPWYGSFYYPHHATWGFNMNYNPWTGWSIGFGFTTGPFHFGFGTGGFAFGMSWGYGGPMWGGIYGGGYFGPPMYRPPCFGPSYPWYGYNRPGYGGGNRPINSPGSGNINWGGGNQINVGGDVNINIGNGNGNNFGGNNLYNKTKDKGISSGINSRDMSKVNVGNRQPANNANNKPGNTVGKPDIGNAKPGNSGNNIGNKPSTGMKPQGRPSKEPNNVFADRDGNIYQKDKTGNIQQNKGGNNWDKPSNFDKMQPTVNNRDRGNSRVNSSPQSRPSNNARPAPSRPAPSARPAGGAGGVKRR